MNSLALTIHPGDCIIYLNIGCERKSGAACPHKRAACLG